MTSVVSPSSLNRLSILESVDIHFGSHLVDAWKALDPTYGSYYLQQFLARSSKKQVYRGEYDAPMDYLKAVERYQLQAHEQGKQEALKTFNQTVLPIVTYYRTLDLQTAEPDATRIQQSTLYSPDKSQAFSLSMARFLMTFKILFMAADKATTEALALAWYFHISNRRKGNAHLCVKGKVHGSPIDIVCTIQDPETFSATNVSLSKEQGRLYALEAEHEVSVPVFYGQTVEVVEPIRWQLGVGIESCCHG